MRTKWILVLGAGIVAAGVAGAAVASTRIDEQPITGEALQRATAAALAHTGGGTVTETEQGDEESFYEVEVRLADGSSVDVQLDESFNVVGQERDDDEDDD